MAIPLTVENLCSGGVVERIHDEIQRVIGNITDPNTEAKKPRKIKLEMTIKPNEHRNTAEVIVSTSSTLQPPKPMETSIMLERDPRTGELGASEVASGENIGQTALPGTLNKGKIATFTDGKSAAAGN